MHLAETADTLDLPTYLVAMRSRTVVALIASATVLLSMGAAGATSAPTLSSPPYGTTWTAEPATNTVVEYAPSASGAAAYVATIAGAATDLNNPVGVVTDAAGDIWVANSGASSITEYAAGASGEAAPVATIAGDQTGLDAPSSIAFADNLIWVTDPADDLVEAFSPDDDGNVLPAERISGSKTLLDHPTAVTAGDGAVWVANTPSAALPSIEEFDNAGNLAPEQRVHGANSGLQTPSALLSDEFDSIYVADSTTNTISEFAPFFGAGSSKPFAKIAGAATGLSQPNGLTNDALGHIVVSNGAGNSIEFFGRRAAGNVAPRRTITGVGGPQGVAVRAGLPGSPRNVRVHAGDASATLRWQAPADTGGGVQGYEVDAFPFPRHPSGRFFTSSVGHETTKTSITLHGLRNGTPYDFEVSAYNAVGQAYVTGPINLTVTPYGPPGRPRGVTAVPGSGSIQVFWARPAQNGGKKITHYRMQYAPCALGHRGCAARTVKTSGSARKVTLTGLTPKAAYRIRVIAQNPVGRSKPSKVVKAGVAGYVVPKPVAPTTTTTTPPTAKPKNAIPPWIEYSDVCVSLVKHVSPAKAVGELTDGKAKHFASRHDADVWIRHDADYTRTLVRAGRIGKWTYIWEDNGFECSLRAPALRTSAGTKFVSIFWDEESLENFTLAVDGHILRRFDPVFPGRKHGHGKVLKAESGLPWKRSVELAMVELQSRLTGVEDARPGWLHRPHTTFWGESG